MLEADFIKLLILEFGPIFNNFLRDIPLTILEKLLISSF
jgi:hypothetical protein